MEPRQDTGRWLEPRAGPSVLATTATKAFPVWQAAIVEHGYAWAVEAGNTLKRLVEFTTAPVRLPAELMVALPAVVRELPGTAHNLRRATGELARLASKDGELTLLLLEAAALARRSGGGMREPSPGRLPGGVAQGYVAD